MKKYFSILGFMIIAIAMLLLFSIPQKSIVSDGHESSITIEQSFDIDTQLACADCTKSIFNDTIKFKLFPDINKFTNMKFNYFETKKIKSNEFYEIYKTDVMRC